MVAERVAAGRLDALTKSVQRLVENLNIPIDQAMDVLEVPDDQREKILSAIDQQSFAPPCGAVRIPPPRVLRQ